MTNTLTQFQEALQALVGQPCWNVQGGAIGSLVSLHIGEKVALDKPLPYPNTGLTPDEHKYRGQYVLYIEDCPWRLDAPDRVLTAWTDDNSPRGAMVKHLRELIGTTITHVEITRPGLDLTMTFDNGNTLRIFPDQSDPEEGDNYALSVPERTYVVGARSTVQVE